MAETIIQLLNNTSGEAGFVIVIVILLLCGVGLPMPEEIPLLAAGYLVYHGAIGLVPSIVLCILAILVGDSIIFMVGKKFGHRIFDIRLLAKLVTPHRLEKANHYFHRFGSRVVFLGRFMAGVRATVFVTAGILKMKYRNFILMDTLAALLSVPPLIIIAYYFGGEIQNGLETVRQTGFALFTVVAVAIVLFTTYSLWRKRKRKENLKAEEARISLGTDGVET